MKTIPTRSPAHLKRKVTKRPAEARGQAEHGWLHARFTFSFAEYHDPNHMGFKSLRVVNNDTIEPGGGFPDHPHKNAEIFTYVIDGQLQHSDSMGNGSVIAAGNLQYMSAGSGMRHSEFNPSKTNRTHLYQIWLLPRESGGTPQYAEKPLGDQATSNSLTLLFSGDGRESSTQIRQDADIYFGKIEAGKTVNVPQSSQTPHAWIQVIKGAATVLDFELATADGLAIEDSPEGFSIQPNENTSLLLFRLK